MPGGQQSEFQVKGTVLEILGASFAEQISIQLNAEMAQGKNFLQAKTAVIEGLNDNQNSSMQRLIQGKLRECVVDLKNINQEQQEAFAQAVSRELKQATIGALEDMSTEDFSSTDKALLQKVLRCTVHEKKKMLQEGLNQIQKALDEQFKAPDNETEAAKNERLNKLEAAKNKLRTIARNQGVEGPQSTTPQYDESRAKDKEHEAKEKGQQQQQQQHGQEDGRSYADKLSSQQQFQAEGIYGAMLVTAILFGPTMLASIIASSVEAYEMSPLKDQPGVMGKVLGVPMAILYALNHGICQTFGLEPALNNGTLATQMFHGMVQEFTGVNHHEAAGQGSPGSKQAEAEMARRAAAAPPPPRPSVSGPS